MTLLSFPDDFPESGPGPQSLTSIHVKYTVTAGGNRFVFNDVGVDLVRITSDVSVILQIQSSATQTTCCTPPSGAHRQISPDLS